MTKHVKTNTIINNFSKSSKTMFILLLKKREILYKMQLFYSMWENNPVYMCLIIWLLNHKHDLHFIFKKKIIICIFFNAKNGTQCYQQG